MIVCAANRFGNGRVVLGRRHYDAFMHDQIRAFGLVNKDCDQGFIDHNGDFLDRRNAWIEALKCEQIRKRVGGDTINGGTLFSENLY